MAAIVTPERLGPCFLCSMPGMFRCRGCNIAVYCSLLCNDYNWERGHKYNCHSYFQQSHGLPPDPVDPNQYANLEELQLVTQPPEPETVFLHYEQELSKAHELALPPPMLPLLDPLNHLQYSESCDPFYDRYELGTLMASGHYGLVFIANVRGSPKTDSLVVKVESLQSNVSREGHEPTIEFIPDLPHIDLIVNVKFRELPHQLKHNIALMREWTRCKGDTVEMVRHLDSETPIPALATHGTRVLQLMVIERQNGTMEALMRALEHSILRTSAGRLIFAQQYLTQLFSTLALLKDRYNFEHNDLKLNNVLASHVEEEHVDKAIYYQMPSNHLYWTRAHFAPMGNCLAKLCDFGISQITYTRRNTTTGIAERVTATPYSFPESYFPETIAERFDPILAIYALNLWLKIPELDALASFAQTALTNHEWKKGSHIKDRYVYHPELILLASPFFEGNRIYNIHADEIARLESMGHIIVPANLDYTERELMPINDLL
jgi:serine/threonine protein kinase